MNELNAKNLTTAVSERLDIDLDDFLEEIITIFSQKIKTTDANNNWVTHLVFEHIGYTTKKINWGRRFHEDDYVEWIVRSWILDILEENANLKTFYSVIGELETLKITSPSPKAIEEAIFHWATQAALVGATSMHSSLTAGMRSLYEWCLDEGLPGFNELRQFELDSIRPAWRMQELAVSLRDFDTGPYTRTEISLIETAIRKRGHSTGAELALIYLARDWGLRPIQLGLLQIQDFGRDALGPYIRVPSVKGVRRSRLRRAEKNMVKRYISDDTAAAVETQIQIAKISVQTNLAVVAKKIGKSRAEALCIPLFPNKYMTEARLDRLCQNPKLVNYALHLDSHRISKIFRDLTAVLSIKSPRKEKFNSENEILKITAYRFRRTKGTSMVLAGASPEEVAEALDHTGIDSIKYYFRYNLELHDFINRAHASSPEISAAVNMWRGRIDEVTETAAGEITIGSLGKCTLGSPCPHHPTVTCYACPSFRPNKSANHQSALESIQQFQDIISSSSTGPVTQQLGIALYGAKAVIVAIQEDERDA